LEVIPEDPIIERDENLKERERKHPQNIELSTLEIKEVDEEQSTPSKEKELKRESVTSPALFPSIEEQKEPENFFPFNIERTNDQQQGQELELPSIKIEKNIERKEAEGKINKEEKKEIRKENNEEKVENISLPKIVNQDILSPESLSPVNEEDDISRKLILYKRNFGVYLFSEFALGSLRILERIYIWAILFNASMHNSIFSWVYIAFALYL
jgi:hypothetical protein